jgi:hypothetical protein
MPPVDRLVRTGTIGLYYNPPDIGGTGIFRFINVANTPIPEPSSVELGSLGFVAPASLACSICLRFVGGSRFSMAQARAAKARERTASDGNKQFGT